MREWLVAIREGKKLSQKDVSERAGISQPSYSNIEHGVPGKGPSVSTAKKISEVLDFDWTQFFDDSSVAQTVSNKTDLTERR